MKDMYMIFLDGEFFPSNLCINITIYTNNCIKKYYLNLIVIEFFFLFLTIFRYNLVVFFYFTYAKNERKKNEKKRKEKLRESEWSFKYLNLTLSN